LATSKKKKWPVILGVAFVIVMIGLVAWTSTGNTQVHSEVCVTFNGVTNCGQSAASNREAAERAATDIACNGLTSGMTQLMQCQNSPTKKVTFK